MRVEAEYIGRSTGNYEGTDYDNQKFRVMGGEVKVRYSECPPVNLREGEACELVYSTDELQKTKDRGGNIIFVAALEEVVTARNLKPADQKAS